MKSQFGDDVKVYKMFDKNYVICLIDLPDEALAPETIDNELEEIPDNTDEKPEEILDKEVEKTEDETPMHEAFEEPKPSDDLSALNKIGGGGPEAPVPGTTSTEPIAPPEETVDGPPQETQEPSEEQAEDQLIDKPGELKKCLVVYDMTSERDEIFRCSSNSVMHAFEDFYENTFKGAMKNIIAKTKETQEQQKKEADLKAKEQELQNKKSKVEKFLKESKNSEVEKKTRKIKMNIQT
jgi:hypothetical protein